LSCDKAISFLLELGADSKAKDKNGKTAQDIEGIGLEYLILN